MMKQHKIPFRKTLGLVEISIILFSFYISYSTRFGPINMDSLGTQYYVFLSMYLIAWLYFSNHFRLYASRRLIGFRYEAWDIVRTTTLCLVFSTLPAFFIREFPLSRLFLLYVWPIHTCILTIFRFLNQEMLKYIRRRGYNSTQVLIVGRNPRAEYIATKLEQNPQLGVGILGFIDAPNGRYSYSVSSRNNLIGSLDDFERILKENVVDEVFITLPFKSFYDKAEEIISICEKVGIDAKIPLDLFENVQLAKATVSPHEIIPVIDLHTSPRMDWKLITKRLIDMLGSLVLFTLLSPLLAVVSILIKTTSKGPVFFMQHRVGYNGRIFDCLKFRTMVDNAEALKQDLLGFNELDGPVFKMKKDPRITKVGRFLRKTSIDELPQLINVLNGDMSLVGPRPPVPSEVDQYNLRDRRRLSMKPGITCLWQVSGRNALPFERWMELDMQYIDQWSLWLDFKILAMTVPAVLRGSGAS